VVEQFSHHLIQKAMQITGGNVSQAAKLLGIPRGTLRYKLDR
jgi:DNA-binding protein Fis